MARLDDFVSRAAAGRPAVMVRRRVPLVRRRAVDFMRVASRLCR
ncbi:hypothetical protein [Frankia gtarii]|nr:hypothetical protein [Frankia gtarii]